TVTFPPQIDATNFINNGSFNLSTLFPFDTSNTQNFTNNGTMFGSVGFRFDNAPATSGVRVPAANFRNRVVGTITAADGVVIADSTVGSLEITPSFLLVSATNIQNEGTLTAGSAGILRLEGENLDLARSGIQIQPISGIGSQNGVLTNFFFP